MTRMFHIGRMIPVAGVFAVFLFAAELRGQTSAVKATQAEPIDVVKAYLQAASARDAATAYRYTSSADRVVRDKKTYIGSQENFTGFALDLGKRLAADMEVWVIEQKLDKTTARLDVGYRLPTGDEISQQLFDWNPGKLNALSISEQAAVITAWDKVKKSGKAVTLEGRETFDLVRETDGWKIFLDWRSQHRVVFKTLRSNSAKLAVKFLRNDFLVRNEDPFQIDFQITNRSNRDIVVKLNHRFEPRRLEKNIDMIACGSLLPLRLRPRETQEISSSYLLRGPLPARSRLEIVYDFRPLPRAAQK